MFFLISFLLTFSMYVAYVHKLFYFLKIKDNFFYIFKVCGKQKGNKCSLRQVGDRFDISISTCECVLEQRVMDFLYDISKDIITFPLTSEEKHALAENFKKV